MGCATRKLRAALGGSNNGSHEVVAQGRTPTSPLDESVGEASAQLELCPSLCWRMRASTQVAGDQPFSSELSKESLRTIDGASKAHS